MVEPETALARREFEGAGVALAADVAGDPSAQPVLFMHGGGQTRAAWGNAVKAVAERGYYAISLDLRGHGESGWSPDGIYGLDRFAEDARVVCRTLSQTPVLVGASLGGLSALLLVGESAEPIAKAIVLVDVTPRIEQEGAEYIGAFMKSAPNGFGSLDEAADAVAAYLPHRARPPSQSGLLKNLRLKEDNRYHWHWDPRFVSGVTSVDPHLYTDRLIAAAGRLSIPTLLVRGGLSRVVSTETVEEFLALTPHADFVSVADADHMVAGDRNDAFNAAVFRFLDKNVPI